MPTNGPANWLVRTLKNQEIQVWENGAHRIWSKEWAVIEKFLKENIKNKDHIVFKTTQGEWSIKANKFLDDTITYKDIKHKVVDDG